MKKTVILGIITMVVLVIVAVDNKNSLKEIDSFPEILNQYNVKPELFTAV